MTEKRARDNRFTARLCNQAAMDLEAMAAEYQMDKNSALNASVMLIEVLLKHFPEWREKFVRLSMITKGQPEG